MSEITIYHGYEFDGRMVAGLPGMTLPDILVEAYTYQTFDDELDAIWRQNNAVDGTEVNVQNEARSLSVGDVVGINGVLWLVESLGWTELEGLPGELVTAENVTERREELNRKFREGAK